MPTAPAIRLTQNFLQVPGLYIPRCANCGVPYECNGRYVAWAWCTPHFFL